MNIWKIFYLSLTLWISNYNTTFAGNPIYRPEINYQNVLSNCLIIIEYQNMRSTHLTYFNGGSLTVNQKFSESFVAGLGAEFSYSRFHHDNQWNLHDLKLIPVFFDFRLNFLSGRVIPYIHTSEGISFNSYRRENIFDLGKFSCVCWNWSFIQNL